MNKGRNRSVTLLFAALVASPLLWAEEHAAQSSSAEAQAAATAPIAPGASEPGADLDQGPIGSVQDLPIMQFSDEFEDLTERCIPLARVKKMAALSEFHVLVTMKDASKYLVQFERCPGLRENATLSYSTRGQRLCRLDGVRPITGLGSRAFQTDVGSITGPSCKIPGFEPVTDAQIEFVMAEYLSWKASQRN